MIAAFAIQISFLQVEINRHFGAYSVIAGLGGGGGDGGGGREILKLFFPDHSRGRGPALTALWSKAPPLIARCLSPLPGFESQPGHVGKLPVTWGQAVVFAGYSGFFHYLQLASHELAIIGMNVTKNKIPND